MVIQTIIDQNTGNLYALKDIDTNELLEVDIQSRLNHPHIMNIIKFYEAPQLGMILPLTDRCLADMMHSNMTTNDKLPILYKVACALEFLHQNKILHLNLNLKNVVLEGINEHHPYLIDYHYSMIVDDINHGRHDSTLRGTLDYLAPELFTDHMYTSSVDIWAFGIMTLYLLSESNIYPIIDNKLHSLIISTFTDPQALFHRLLAGVRSDYFPLCLDFLSKILVLDPKQRLTAQELCEHPLFNKFRFPIIGSILKPEMSSDYADDNREILKIFISSITTWYPNERAELLFLSVDLYYRVSSFYKNHQASERIKLTATCLWMASKIINATIHPLSEYLQLFSEVSLTPDIICSMEHQIIKHLNGILYNSHVYNLSITGDQLLVSIPLILHSDHTYYAEISNQTPYLIDYLNNVTTTIYPTKDITIKMLNIIY